MRFAYSYKPSGGDGGDWEVEVAATPGLLRGVPLTVRVTLEEEGVRPPDYGLYVLDLDRTVAVAVTEGAFEVALSAERPARRFRVISGTEAYAESARRGIPLVPLDFALDPAYPNPFTGSATLSYQLGERARVVLEVFDVLGRRVGVLVDAEQDAGRYEVGWSGQSEGWASVASGVYICRLRTGAFMASQRLVLVR